MAVWTGMIPGDCRTITWEVVWIRGLITPYDVSCLCAMMNQQIKGIQGDVVEMTDRVDANRLQRCADACEGSLGYFPREGLRSWGLVGLVVCTLRLASLIG